MKDHFDIKIIKSEILISTTAVSVFAYVIEQQTSIVDPYKIIKKADDTNYIIEILDRNEKSTVCSHEYALTFYLMLEL